MILITYLFVGGTINDPGKDYTFVHGETENVFSFKNGEREKSLIFRIIDDNLVEINETFKFVITKTSHDRVKDGKYNTTTVTIGDDDSK